MDHKKEIAELVAHLITTIDDDYRSSGSDSEDDTPSTDLTCATNDDMSEWSYQTGDNSYMGSCYFYPHWGVATLTRDCDPAEIAQEICNQWGDLTA